MQIGRLNKEITFQSATQVSDGMGNFTETWGDEITMPAAIWPTSSKELVALNATTFEITHKIKVRYRSTISTTWRIKFGSRYFAIVSKINPSEKNEYLELLCKEAI